MTKDLVSLEELRNQLSVTAQEDFEQEKTSMLTYLSIRGKQFSLGDDKLGNELDVIILLSAYENAFYDSAYDPDNPQPPVCFAISLDDEDLTPNKVSPKIQADKCSDCPLSEWGSANVGKGKACKNSRRILLAAYDSKAGANTSDLVAVRVPPASLTNFSRYVKAIKMKTNLPLFAVVTTIAFDDRHPHPVITFAFKELVEDAAVLQDLIAKRSNDELKLLIQEPYDVSSYKPDDSPDSAKSKRRSKMS